MDTFFEYETVMIPLSNGKEQEFAIMEEFDLGDYECGMQITLRPHSVNVIQIG